jgi:glycosyltransferase involved in cell wall biosynthesis
MTDTAIRVEAKVPAILDDCLEASDDADHLPASDGLPPLRIAMVAPPYFEVPPTAYGGVEAVVADLANGLVRAGHQVTLLGAGRNGTRARFHQIWPDTEHARLGEAAPEVRYAAAARGALAQLAEQNAIDVVHDHTHAGPLNAFYLASLGLPTVVTAHGPLHSDLLELYTAIGRDISLVAISERQRSHAPQLNWAATVYNGLEPSDWPYQTEKEDFALFLGRFHPDKGAHLALDAAHAAGLPMVLAGKCQEAAERSYFEQEVVPRLWATDEVVGVADAQVKRDLLARARCLLFPVRWEEPFGMVMIEAMVCGTPVVALRAGAVPEVVEHGVTGLICDEIEQLPAALAAVTQLDPAACRQHVVDNFHADLVARGYAAVYRSVLAGMHPHRRVGIGDRRRVLRRASALQSPTVR